MFYPRPLVAFCLGIPSRRSHRFIVVSSRRSSNWRTYNSFPAFFHRAPVTRYTLRRGLLCFLPIAGGLTVYLNSTPKDQADLLSSPAIIPCPAPNRSPVIEPTILPPAEPRGFLLPRIFLLLRDRIWEPIRAGLRFAHLFAIFLPVIVCAPMLLVGGPDRDYREEKWGAVWWYGFLVRKMEAAGPTFIKVSSFLPLCMFTHSFSIEAGPMGSYTGRLIPHCLMRAA